ncbi:MAG: hypothetical protein MJ237_03675 [bacterium]|nr:hypothetical protein [bacterium]
MNIPAINQISSIPHICKMNRSNNTAPNYGLRLSGPLSNDTISFKAGGTIIADIIEYGLSSNYTEVQQMANQYMNILEAVASKLKNVNVSFDREYSESNSVKSIKSVMSKIARSGSLLVPDQIRATLFIKNPYDLSILFNKVLPELENSEYLPAQIDVPVKEVTKKTDYIPKSSEIKKGSVKMPDIDIRLRNTEDEPLIGIPSGKKCLCSGAKPNGYEDIQIRLINKNSKIKNLQHELIILMGPEYAKAKEYESENIYGNVRRFKQLHIATVPTSTNKNVLEASRYADLITKLLQDEISSKLFSNAKNIDYYNINLKDPINITPEKITLLENYFISLEKAVIRYYNSICNIKEKDVVKSLLLEDIKTIEDIHDRLSSVIEKYKTQK